MARTNANSRPGTRRALEVAFALCTLWLVVQNAVLLAFVPWQRLPETGAILTAVIKTAVLVLGPMWILGSAALLGWVFMTWLTREPRGTAAETEWEMDHGRAR